jgi:hypothetical protein
MVQFLLKLGDQSDLKIKSDRGSQHLHLAAFQKITHAVQIRGSVHPGSVWPIQLFRST